MNVEAHTYANRDRADGGFNKFTWLLLSGFGAILLVISVAALNKLSSVSDQVRDQNGNINVIIAKQDFQEKNLAYLSGDVKVIDSRLRQIENRQLAAR